jgi:phosphonate transport system substrate-binding protein
MTGFNGISRPIWLLYPAAWLLTACLLTACSGKRQQGYTPTFEAAGWSRKVLTMGVPGQSFYESSDLLVQYINSHLDSVKIKTVACAGIEDYEEKLRNGYFDLTIINGQQLLGAERNGYRVVGRIADDSRAVIFVNKDSSVYEFGDIEGHTICLPGQHTLSGAMMPLLFLYQQGVDVNGGLRRLYVPTFESAMLNVYLGHASLGATWKPMWEMYLKERPEIAGKLEARWETPPLINAGLLLRRTIDPPLAAKLAGLFFQMKMDDQGLRALQRLNLSGFEAADSDDFRPMEAFLREYDAYIK